MYQDLKEREGAASILRAVSNICFQTELCLWWTNCVMVTELTCAQYSDICFTFYTTKCISTFVPPP